jgi:hypothetical protein
MPIDTIIQGGCVGITLMLLVFGYRLGSQALTIAANHLQHIAEALGQMNAKMDVLIGVAVDTAKTAHDDSEKSVGPRGRKGRPGKDA